MVSYLEEKALREATFRLLQVKWKAESQLMSVEAWLETQVHLSLEQRNKITATALEVYDRTMIPAEKEYDQEIERLRVWRKVRQQSRSRG